MIVVNREVQFLDDLKSLEHYILSEVNVRQLTVSQDKHKYGITLKADPNFRLLGARLKGDQKKVVDYLKTKVTEAELEQFLAQGKLTVFGHELTSEEVYVSYTSGQTGAKDHGYETHSDGKTIVMLDTSEDSALVEEGLAREITNRTPMRLEPLPADKKATVSNVSVVKDAEVSLWLIAEGVADTVTVGLNGRTIRIRLKSSSDKLLSYGDLLYEVIDF
ncbi:hypothetical protein ANCDUO_07726 [Ancylostoma duodenale]|uniref:Uncharacterized protein n=1 Tax=Ancylostoma duodenale TaxID=51022 RepID=A0A0C2GL96_9BILA|nr:hypothetical protein ANCDUO_07726 [Ancylostoma duodenale]